MMYLKNKKLLIAGGGTGGHVYSGLSVAESWRNSGGQIVFVGTQKGKEATIIPNHGFEIRYITVGQLKGKGLVGKLITLIKLPLAIGTAIKIINKEKPDVVLGIGGYVSGPTLIAAKILRKKTAVVDQNAMPGFTNRMLGKIVSKVFTSFKESNKYFNKSKVVCTGNPTRAKIRSTPYKKPVNQFCLLVFGGSQGAVTLNQIVIDAIYELKDMWAHLTVYHQAGANDKDKIENFYSTNNIKAYVSNFFYNMDELYADAHLVICRSGAGSVTELAMSGRPAIFVPYPFAADNHQKANADVFVKADAAWCFEQKKLDKTKLASLLNELYQNPDTLEQKASNMQKQARPMAAKAVVNELNNMCKRNKNV